MTMLTSFSPLVMAHRFLPLKEAAKQYEASEVTLRRLAREVVKDAAHEHRALVRPSLVEYEAIRKRGGQFEYEISTQLLDLKYQRFDQTGGGENGIVADAQADVGSAAMKVLEDTNTLLREQLAVKDEQIRQLNDSLRAMQQQQNATTMVLARLSERLPLLSAGTPVTAEMSERSSPGRAESTCVKKERRRTVATKSNVEKKRGAEVRQWWPWGRK
jgi:hypothetical protein